MLGKLILFVLIAGGLSPDARAVFHGELVTPAEGIAKSIVKVGEFCTGTALSSTVVVSAAHCALLVPGGLKGRFISGTSRCGQARIVDVKFAPNAVRDDNGSFKPDIVLLRVGSELCETENAVMDPQPAKAGDILLGAGFGKGNPDRQVPYRMKISVLEQTRAALENLFSDLPGSDPTYRLARGFIDKFSEKKDFYTLATPVVRGSTLCNGDSGGPVYTESRGRVFLRGVISGGIPHSLRGVRECNFGFIQGFAPVAGNAAWIETALREWQ